MAYIIKCYRKKSKFEKPVLSFVSNHPKPGEPIQFTESEKHAHVFNEMNFAKNIRDDALQHAKGVTIFNI